MRADVVMIATKGPFHTEIAISALQHGAKYIIVEKPMASSVEECDQMIGFAVRRGATVVVDKIDLYDDVYQLLRDKAISDEWEELRSMYIQKPGIGLGCLGTHSFDQANFLFGRMRNSVTAWIDPIIGTTPIGEQFKDPGGLVILDYGGLRAIVSQIEDGAGPQSLELHFTGARVFHDPKNGTLDIHIRDLSVKHGPGCPPKYMRYDVPVGVNVKSNILQQIRLVIDDLISDRPILVEGEYGRDAIEILVAAHVSQELGNVLVLLPLEKEECKKFTLSNSVFLKAIDECGGKEMITSVSIEWSQNPEHLISNRKLSNDHTSRYIFGNSIHGIDLMPWLSGPLEKSSVYVRNLGGPFRWFMNVRGISSKGTMCAFSSSWDNPVPWRVTFAVHNRRYVLAPRERCTIQVNGVREMGEIEPSEDDKLYKARFYEQAKLFVSGEFHGKGMESINEPMRLAQQLTDLLKEDQALCR